MNFSVSFYMSDETKHDQTGMSIMELMLGLVISSLVIASLMVVTKNYSDSADEFRADSKLALSVKSFFDHLNLHASSAGFSPIDSALTKIVSDTPFSLNNLTVAIGNRAGSYADVNSLRFVYDSDKNTREYATYLVSTRTKAGRNQKYVTLTRSYKVGSVMRNMFVNQILLDDVSSFRCSQRVIRGAPRAIDCQLVTFSGDAPIVSTHSYEFTVTNTQTY